MSFPHERRSAANASRAACSLPECLDPRPGDGVPGEPRHSRQRDRRMHSFTGNRVVADTGSRFPIFNSPIGYFARSQLAGAVSAAGGMGLFELNSTGLDATAREYDDIRARTSEPFGLQMFLRVLL